MSNKGKKKNRKFRFFNRPVKIGATVAGVGLGIEFGQADIYNILAEHPKYIFWLMVIKYASYIIGVLFAGGGVVKQAKEDLESIKIGETFKEGVNTIETLKEMPRDTKEDEKFIKEDTVGKAFSLAREFFNKRRTK